MIECSLILKEILIIIVALFFSKSEDPNETYVHHYQDQNCSVILRFILRSITQSSIISDFKELANELQIRMQLFNQSQSILDNYSLFRGLANKMTMFEICQINKQKLVKLLIQYQDTQLLSQIDISAYSQLQTDYQDLVNILQYNFEGVPIIKQIDFAIIQSEDISLSLSILNQAKEKLSDNDLKMQIEKLIQQVMQAKNDNNSSRLNTVKDVILDTQGIQHSMIGISMNQGIDSFNMNEPVNNNKISFQHCLNEFLKISQSRDLNLQTDYLVKFLQMIKQIVEMSPKDFNIREFMSKTPLQYLCENVFAREDENDFDKKQFLILLLEMSRKVVNQENILKLIPNENKKKVECLLTMKDKLKIDHKEIPIDYFREPDSVYIDQHFPEVKRPESTITKFQDLYDLLYQFSEIENKTTSKFEDSLRDITFIDIDPNENVENITIRYLEFYLDKIDQTELQLMQNLSHNGLLNENQTLKDARIKLKLEFRQILNELQNASMSQLIPALLLYLKRSEVFKLKDEWYEIIDQYLILALKGEI
ncbi:UNKNOWN [Stylonychia lemnae]|uniref:Uncharacterized protein n=1 Tax=Stylonychia lemnae TaxID=5949 RepID=A0A078B8W6_STYLE|nr:UNKNOWN [Stylonychia lemnae]|eukprot:CDW90854.1 UNKNOWN [Stylonychia lemnae]